MTVRARRLKRAKAAALPAPATGVNTVISPPAAMVTAEEIAGGRVELVKLLVDRTKKRGRAKRARDGKAATAPAWHADVARLIEANPQWRSKKAIEIARLVVQQWGREDEAMAFRAKEAGVPYEPPWRPGLTAVRTAIPAILKEI